MSVFVPTDLLIHALPEDSLLAAELLLLALGVALAFIFPALGPRWFSRVEEILGRVAHRRRASVLLVAALCLILRLALLPWLPVPVPGTHDEYSYLLQADTFVHGRLTNPTPPLWTHFETFHVLFHPTYASKYPPMQGLILAFGQKLLGNPWLGVLLSAVAMCAAICWMLQGWLPPGWALLGGLLAVIRLGTFSYWVNSYWGGAAAAIGGALVLGAFPRIVRKSEFAHAWTMGLGLAILANSRPYEGLLLGVGVAVALAAWLVPSMRRGRRGVLTGVVVPLTVCLVITGGAMAYYNWRVTGNPLVLPAELHARQYDSTPVFWWQPPRQHAPIYRDKLMADLYTQADTVPYERARSLAGFAGMVVARGESIYLFFLGPALALPFIMLPWVLHDRRVRWLLWLTLFMLAGFAGTLWFWPHYAAPATALFYLLLLQCMRHLRVWGRRRKTGSFVVRWVPVVCLVMALARLRVPAPVALTWCGETARDNERAHLLQQLEELPGRQLVIVRYASHQSPHQDWVHNGADLQTAKVIWARDEGDAGNQELIQQFTGRHVWMVRMGENQPDSRASLRLAPVDPSPASPAASVPLLRGDPPR